MLRQLRISHKTKTYLYVLVGFIGSIVYLYWFFKKRYFHNYFWQFISGSIVGLVFVLHSVYTKLFRRFQISGKVFAIKDNVHNYWQKVIFISIPILVVFGILRSVGPDSNISLFSFVFSTLIGITLGGIIMVHDAPPDYWHSAEKFEKKYLYGQDSPMRTFLDVSKFMIVWLFIFVALLIISDILFSLSRLGIIGWAVAGILSYVFTSRLLKQEMIGPAYFRSLLKMPGVYKFSFILAILIGFAMKIFFDTNTPTIMLIIIMLWTVLPGLIYLLKKSLKK